MICALDAYIQYLSDFEINSTNIEAFGPSDFLQFGNEAVYISLGLIVNNIKYQHIKISHFYDILQYPNISMLGYRNITVQYYKIKNSTLKTMRKLQYYDSLLCLEHSKKFVVGWGGCANLF